MTNKTVLENKACNYCKVKNERVRQLTNELMNYIQTDTLFATRNKLTNDFVVYAGGTCCSDELDMSCGGCDDFKA